MWANQLFRQQGVDLQFEEDDKVVMRLKSTEKKKTTALKFGQEKLCVLYNIQSYFFHLEFNSVSLAKLLKSWRKIILDTA